MFQQTPRSLLLLSLALAGFAAGCDNDKPQEQPGSVVYGQDNRQDVYAHGDATLRQRAAESTVALMHSSDFNARDPENVRFNGSTLGARLNLCAGERFAEDPTSAWCSGTLIADDLVLTAGHCVRSQSDCRSVRFVFKYYRDAEGSLERVTTDDIFSCSELVAHRYNSSIDYAVVRLDRSAAPRFTPAPVKRADEALSRGDQVAVIGSGSGIPFKIDNGGRVREPRANSRDYFKATTDTFGGNSGSGVYDENGQVVGILVRGDTDYVRRGNCSVVNTCTEGGCNGEGITYVARALEGLCAAESGHALCSAGSDPGPGDGNPPASDDPVDASQGYSFNASNTASASRNTADGYVNLNAGDELTVGTCGLSQASFRGDTFLRLTAGSTELGSNDDACNGRGSQIRYTAQSAGRVIIHAGCYGGGSCSGFVAVSVSPAESNPPPNNPAQPVDASQGYSYRADDTNSARTNTQNGEFRLDAGDTVILGTCGLSGASFTGDTYLRLFHSGAQVAENDDACGGAGSQIRYTAASAGTFTILGGCYGEGSCSGTVAVQLEDSSPPSDDPSPDPNPDPNPNPDPTGSFRLRVVAGNITSGNGQSYDPGHGIRIFQGLRPDVALIQEFNYKSESASDLREFVTTAFGSGFSYTRGSTGNIPNGVVSRYPIRDSGIWVDSSVGNRNFAWARIDIPGDKDLWAVSVHFLTRNASVRNTEANQLLRYVRQHVPSGDYLVIGGDFNTNSYSESAFSTLSAVIRTNHRPADQNGRQGTNASRSKPYDHVLPSHNLDPYHVPVVIGQNSFPHGLVFDSRVYTPLSDVSPVRQSDSGAPSMQHMAVVKDFVIPGTGGDPDPNPDPNPGPTPGPSSGLDFRVSNTNSARQNTADAQIQLEAGQQLTVGSCGLPGANYTGDTYLRLTVDGSEVAENDDACGGRGSQIVYTAQSAGAVTVRVGCYDDGSCSGHVAWQIATGTAPAPEPVEGRSGHFSFQVRQTESATRNTEDRSLRIQAGETLRFATCGMTGSRYQGDTFIRVIGSNGATVAVNDDACGRGSSLQFSPSTTGDYILRVGCYSSGSCSGTAAWTLQ